MKSVLFTIITAVMLIACETQQNPTVSSAQKKSLNPIKKISKPSFEPMSLEKYKATYPDLAGLNHGIDKFFDRYINVFGVTIAAMPNTPIPEIIHSAKIYAQLLDDNEDFIPDDLKIYNYHQKDKEGRNSLIVLVDTKALDNKWIAFKPGQRFWVPAQALRPGHAGVGHSRDGEMDIAVEELFHKYGKSLQHIYPSDFGLPDNDSGATWSSTLSDAMDQARGINRKIKPVNGKWIYPRNAWYTYDDTSCEWGCQIDEYLWHIWGTNIGYYESLTRAPDRPKYEGKPGGWCDNISGEWKICSKEKLKEVDFPSFNLLNNKGYQLPTRIPFGEYGGNNVKYHGYEVDVALDEGIRKFSINRKSSLTLTLKRGNTYYFDQSLENNSGLSFRFNSTKSEDNLEKTEYRNGVLIKGKPGVRGSYIRITIDNNTPEKLYIYCPEEIVIKNDIKLLIKD